MKRKRYIINKRGKQRLFIIISSFLLISIILTMGQFYSLENNIDILTELLKKVETGKDGGDIDDPKKLEALGAIKGAALGSEKIRNTVVAHDSNQPKPSTQPEDDTENPDVGNFFDSSLFIGDSRMQGLMIYSGTTGTGYTEKGLDVTGAVSKAFIWHEGSQLTIPQALKLGQAFDRIIIKLGINELGWRSTDLFTERYGEFVALVKEAQPEAEIYLHAILPVTQAKSSDGSVFNNSRISEFNALIKEISEKYGVYYIDLASKLADETGFLPPEGAAKDGIHLKSEFCKKWLVYLKDAIEEDR